MTPSVVPLVRRFNDERVRYVLMGIAGLNLYAQRDSQMFVTQDFDLFLPPDADNLVGAWACCDAEGLELWR